MVLFNYALEKGAIMAVRVNKSIIVNGTTIELEDLIDHPWAFTDLLRTQFNESTFVKKDSESYENYLKRLFALLYYRQNRPERPARQRSNNQQESSKSDDLCFDIVRQSPKTSRIVFKESKHVYRLKSEILTSLLEADKSKHNKRNGLHLTDKFIGVELEFIGEYGKVATFIEKMRKLVGDNKFEAPLRYSHNNGSKWVLGEDGSVYPKKSDKLYREGLQGYELTSPILKLSSKKDMKTLADVCNLIKDVMGGYTNSNCGTHIHMSFPVDKSDMTPIRISECEFLRHFVRAYRSSEESLFDRLVPLSRRANKGRYCKTASVNYMHQRYRKINVTNYIPNKDHLHLEFRQLDGTLDSDKIILWAKLQTLFVDSALKSWNTAKARHEEPVIESIKLEDIVVGDAFKNDSESVEKLMKLAKMIA